MSKYPAKYQDPKEKEFEEKIVQIKRLSKKTKGGNKISFSALVVVGDYRTQAGVGFAKGPDVLSSIQKAVRRAKKRMVKVTLTDVGSIPHQTYFKQAAAVIMMRPAREGTGVIAGGGIRAVVEAFGVRNIVTKRMGSANKSANAYATFEAMKQFVTDAQAQPLGDKQKSEAKTPTEKEPVKPNPVKAPSAPKAAKQAPATNKKPATKAAKKPSSAK